MFNHKAKKIIIGVITLTTLRSTATGSIISSLANIYTAAKEMDTLKQGFKPGNIGGIYDTQLQIALDNDIVGGSEAIDQIYIKYSSREECQTNKNFFKIPQPLQKSDIVNILLQKNNNIGRMNAANFTKKQREDTTQGFKESCQRVLTCMGEDKINYDICSTTINREYNKIMEQGVKKQSMISDFYGIQFFSNGTLDDSTFDLLVDMELIGNIMYGNNQKPTQTIYYRMPTAAGGNKTMNPLTPGTTTPNNSNNTNTNNNNTPSNTITISDNQTLTNDSTNNDTIIIGGNDNNSNTTENSQERTMTDISQSITNTNNINASTGLPLFDSNICIDDITNIEDDISPNTNENPFIDDGLTPAAIDQIRNDYVDHINGQYTSYTPTTIPSDIPSDPRIPGENNTIGAILENMDLMDQINECIDSCNQNYNGTDALVCKASCMCSTIPESSNQDYNRYLDYKIRFCRMPTQVEAPYTSTTTVQSIEEIVDAINSTLTALRTSGALNKRNETQEYLDTSLRNLNMADSFIFSFNIATKISPNTKNQNTIQKETDQAFTQATKDTSIYTPDRDQFSKSTNTTPNKTITQETQKILATTNHIATRQEIFTQTISQMDTFRKRFALQMEEINNITTNMRVKAQNAK